MPAKNQHNISIGISNSQPAALTLRRRQTDERAKKNKGFPYAIRRLYPSLLALQAVCRQHCPALRKRLLQHECHCYEKKMSFPLTYYSFCVKIFSLNVLRTVCLVLIVVAKLRLY